VTAGTDAFKRALAHLVGGVVIVTTRDAAGEPRGMTATAVCSVSLDPPLVMACMDRASNTHAALEESGVFALNILPEAARGLAQRFASSSGEKFEGVLVQTGDTGAPLLSVALAHCDCEVERSVVAGDHTIFIGRVVSADSRPGGSGPLVYFRGRYGTVDTPDDDGAGEAEA
jgi:flavin reductase (DIM6/NTAB) family NADH-FMN oxidoreductase RutF